MEIEPDGKPLRPLTKRKDNGELYIRDTKHEQHIRLALSVPVPEFESWIRAFGYGKKRYTALDTDAPSPEALVYLYRHFLSEVRRFKQEQRERASVNIQRILVAILESIYAAIVSHLPGKLKGVLPNHRDMCREELQFYVLNLLNDPGDAADPLEIAFGLVLKRKSIKLADKYRKQSIKETTQFVSTPEQVNEEIDYTLLNTILNRLTPDQRLIAERRFLQVPPTTQKELARELDVTDRTLREYERKVKVAIHTIIREIT